MKWRDAPTRIWVGLFALCFMLVSPFLALVEPTAGILAFLVGALGLCLGASMEGNDDEQ